MSETYTRPVPYVTADAAAFWEGARAHRLVLPRCGKCQQFHYYPRLACPHCGSRNLSHVPVSGRGTVYTFSIQYRSQGPGFEPPYITAMVDLEEGPRMLANITGVEAAPENVHCGMAVEAVFNDASDEITVINFQPVAKGTNDHD